MKILLVSPLPPPVGGICSWTVNFLNYYSEHPTKWQVFHQNTATRYRNITNINIWHRLIGGIKDTYKFVVEFKKNLDIIQPDVIQIASSASLALIKDILLIYLAAKRKIPVITHFHFGRIPSLSMSKNWEWRLLCKVILKSQIVIVIDQKSLDALFRAGFKNVVNIPNPISGELEEIAKKRQVLSTEIKKGRIIFIGHVERNKGVFELVEACKPILEIRELLVVGPYENGIKDELTDLARTRENGSWLKFPGSLNNEEVLDQLGSALLMALPSYTEGFPIVIIEAMAMGCPVVATDVGAIPEMLDIESENSCGICVKPKNIEELSSALFSLIHDPENAKKMGRNGTKKVLANYTFSNIIKRYENVWMNALAENIHNKMSNQENMKTHSKKCLGNAIDEKHENTSRIRQNITFVKSNIH